MLFEGEALPHFNEVDECAGLDGLVTYRLWRELGFEPENTLHDLRWGQTYGKDYVWVLLISGAAPPAHFIDGWKGASSERQPGMYFRLGGGTLKGVSKPGHIVWSRVYVAERETTCGHRNSQSRVLARGRNRSTLERNHAPVADHARGLRRCDSRPDDGSTSIESHPGRLYAQRGRSTPRAARIKAAALSELGLEVCLCGDVKLS